MRHGSARRTIAHRTRRSAASEPWNRSLACGAPISSRSFKPPAARKPNLNLRRVADLQGPGQPRLCHCPITLDGPRRDAEEETDLLLRHAREIAHLHNFRLPGVDRAQLVQCFIHYESEFALVRADPHGLVQR